MYKNIILGLVFCGFEVWSVTLRDECRLPENWVLHGVCGPKGGRSDMTLEKIG